MPSSYRNERRRRRVEAMTEVLKEESPLKAREIYKRLPRKARITESPVSIGVCASTLPTFTSAGRDEEDGDAHLWTLAEG